MRKYTLAALTVILALVLCLPAYAKNGGDGGLPGRPGGGSGGGNGTPGGGNLAVALTDGTPFTYAGTIIEMVRGEGFVLATDTGNVTVYGLGPASYWTELGVDKPAVGDTVEVSGFAVDFNGVTRNIVFTIVIDDQTVQLRDQETGQPLWLGSVGGPHVRTPGQQLLLTGEPFHLDGTVVSVRLGKGLTLDTADGEVVIYGLGPVTYWTEQDVPMPVAGDAVSVDGMIVQVNDADRYVAFAITVNGLTIQLRDPETGKPLWSAGKGK